MTDPDLIAPGLTAGTVSHGTLRTEDLLQAFSAELERLAAIKAGGSLHIGKYDQELIAEARLIPPEHEHAPEIVTDLMDALNELAPEGYHFGSHEGDGSDFGFWPNGEPPDGDAWSGGFAENH